MKRFLKILLPILLSGVIIAGICWYFLSYDKGLTQDVLRSCGSYFASRQQMKTAAWFYDLAYKQDYDPDSVAIELAEKYIQIGNYTRAEAALYQAIQDGGDVPVYIALSKAYVAQDKLYDAVELLDGISDPQIKQKLDELRPACPTSPDEQKTYHQLISVTVEAPGSKLYVNPNGEYPSVTTHEYPGPIALSEGENLIYAVAVSENGLVSPLSILKYEVSGVIEIVDFQDKAIEAEVRKLLNIPGNKTIYSNELWDIAAFTIPANAKDYSDLRYMLYLQSLTVENGVPGQLSVLNSSIDSLADTLKILSIQNTALSSEDMDETVYLLSGGSDKNFKKIRSAVESTAGEVLKYDGELIEATYFSCSGGKTEDAAAVWGADIPYLQAVDSPGEEKATHFTDTVRFSVKEFSSRLGQSFSGNPGKWIEHISYTEGSGVSSIVLQGTTYSGTQIRQKLGLRSTAFVMTITGDTVTITTKGFGHRVGMSQYGAEAMAVQGSDYRQILAHYYTDTTLSTLVS